MADPDDILGNDRSGIQVSGDVMAGGADHLHASLKSGMVGFGPRKGGKEGMVNIDDPVRVLADEFVGENLHIPG